MFRVDDRQHAVKSPEKGRNRRRGRLQYKPGPGCVEAPADVPGHLSEILPVGGHGFVGNAMTITITCECGRKLKANPENAGMKGRCPDCGQIFTIPKPELGEEGDAR